MLSRLLALRGRRSSQRGVLLRGVHVHGNKRIADLDVRDVLLIEVLDIASRRRGWRL